MSLSGAVGSITVPNSYHTQMANAATASGVLSTNTNATWLGQPIYNEGMHQFNCQKVENGWTLNYRGKNYIAADIDSLMDQMKAAMVMDRIEK